MNEFRPGGDGWEGSVEAYQSDLRAILARIQGLEDRLVAAQGAGAAGGQGSVLPAPVLSAPTPVPQATLPHTHVLADVTDLSGLTIGTSQVTGLEEQIRDTVAAFLVAGANVTITHDDGANTLTIAAS